MDVYRLTIRLNSPSFYQKKGCFCKVQMVDSSILQVYLEKVIYTVNKIFRMINDEVMT